MDDDLLEIYSQRLQQRAAQARSFPRLTRADATVERTSPLCGSRIMLDVRLRDEAIDAIGFSIEACMLGQAGAALLAETLPGRAPGEAARVAAAVRHMLENPQAPLPGGAWADLELLRPAADLRNRHGSVMLPFSAVTEALQRALDSHGGR